jgi:hypothetical protein
VKQQEAHNAAAAEIRCLDTLNEAHAKESHAATITINNLGDHLNYID